MNARPGVIPSLHHTSGGRPLAVQTDIQVCDSVRRNTPRQSQIGRVRMGTKSTYASDVYGLQLPVEINYCSEYHLSGFAPNLSRCINDARCRVKPSK